MTSKPSFAAHLAALAALGVCGAFVLGLSIGLHSQPQQPSLISLADQKADISRMDWVLLQGQLHAIQWMFFEDLSNPVIPMSYRYNSEKGKIVSGHLVRPGWYATTNLEKAKETLQSRGVTYCMGVMTNLPLPEMLQLREEVNAACTVDFYTLTFDESRELTRKDIATYEDGQVVLK